jgi:TolB protein
VNETRLRTSAADLSEIANFGLRGVALRGVAPRGAALRGMALLTVALLGMALLLAARPARAELSIDITQGVADPVPIAIVPFQKAQPADGGFDLAAVVQRDLESSGRFRGMAREKMKSEPVQASAVQTGEWKAAGNDYIAVGRVSAAANGQLTVECDLVNLLSGQRLGGQRVTATQGSLRNAAHQIADFIYEKIVGTRGAFATRIAYVAVNGKAPAEHYQLIVADSDGENPRVALESKLPIMSPAWSPDGKWLAYVSFENRVSAIYLQQLSSGERRQISARAGVNGAPAFSPDGTQLALTLSGSGGNLDIYLLQLATQQLTRLTEDPAIDTEAAWSADGKSLYFTSDRAGSAQIYRMQLATRQTQRVSFPSGEARSSSTCCSSPTSRSTTATSASR